jgi:uncharacterized membrane protein
MQVAPNPPPWVPPAFTVRVQIGCTDEAVIGAHLPALLDNRAAIIQWLKQRSVRFEETAADHRQDPTVIAEEYSHDMDGLLDGHPVTYRIVFFL